MSNITKALNKRAHVVHYKTNVEDIPTKSEIEEILRIGYPLATSKQNAFPYKAHVLGPNKERSAELYSFAEGNKVDFDGDVGEKYQPNPNLFHIATAPWTLIFTPRISPGNQFAQEQCAKTGTQWEMGRETYIPKGREAWGIEVGMLAKCITGAVLDNNWDTSYNACFPHWIEPWNNSEHFQFVKYHPFLIQTIGKAQKYKWQNMQKENLAKDTCPPFEDIFSFEDDNE
tara:strand:+ start:1027 stop:1713 length:687 start_codon:yes stop_codon:yes gene_type:complete